VAVPLLQITAFAVIGEVAPAEIRPRAAAASPRIPGHVRCPCGSGARYRDCCRP
jgi:uncharacterized protein YecA (UPF0149 family)